MIDPLLKFIHASDVNAYAEMSRVLEPLSTFARQSGAHVLLVHHQKKGGQHAEEGGSLGSTAIDGLVDTIITLNRNGTTRTISTRQRYGSDMPETNLAFDEDTGLFSVAGQASETKLTRVKESISNLLRGGQSLTEDEIRRDVGGDTGATGRAIRSMFETGELIRTGPGNRGGAFKYSLPDEKSNSLAEQGQFTESGPGVSDSYSAFSSKDEVENCPPLS